MRKTARCSPPARSSVRAGGGGGSESLRQGRTSQGKTPRGASCLGAGEDTRWVVVILCTLTHAGELAGIWKARRGFTAKTVRSGAGRVASFTVTCGLELSSAGLAELTLTWRPRCPGRSCSRSGVRRCAVRSRRASSRRAAVLYRCAITHRCIAQVRCQNKTV